jgi:hypothetical protein
MIPSGSSPTPVFTAARKREPPVVKLERFVNFKPQTSLRQTSGAA